DHARGGGATGRTQCDRPDGHPVHRHPAQLVDGRRGGPGGPDLHRVADQQQGGSGPDHLRRRGSSLRSDLPRSRRRGRGRGEEVPGAAMNAHAMFDTAGPRAQRWIRIITVLSVLLLLGLFALAYYQFYASGALAPSKWRTFTEPGTVRYLGTALKN